MPTNVSRLFLGTHPKPPPAPLQRPAAPAARYPPPPEWNDLKRLQPLRPLPYPKPEDWVAASMAEFSERRAVALAVWTLSCVAGDRVELRIEQVMAFLESFGRGFSRARLEARVSSLVTEGRLERAHGGKVKISDAVPKHHRWL